MRMNGVTRRDVLGAVAVAGFTPPAFGQAAAWPGQPVQMIVPFPASGGTDAFAVKTADVKTD